MEELEEHKIRTTAKEVLLKYKVGYHFKMTKKNIPFVNFFLNSLAFKNTVPKFTFQADYNTKSWRRGKFLKAV